MQSIEERQRELIEEFSSFEDWMQKYEYIIELGKELPLIDEAYRNEDHLIKGCQSRVWLHAALDKEGNLVFTADSDAIITRGMVAMVIRVLNGQKPLDVASSDLHFVNDIGLSTHLSPTRSNGLAAMIKQMKMYGLALSAA